MAIGDWYRIFLDAEGAGLYQSTSFDGLIGAYKSKVLVTSDISMQHTDLIENPNYVAAGGGGLLTHPGMGGGMRG